ncbi:MAG: Biotin synthase [Syntrophorhabdus sp. PtaU1.Bin050]|nr:MAG: Biotin synthase [Syntrophorhabdus sp. PtaU1.Bin050]
MDSNIEALAEKAIKNRGINNDDARSLYELGSNDPFLLMAYGSRIREHFKGKKVSLCCIVNAKSGVCPENCRFCAQSAHYHTDAPVYPLLPAKEIVEKAKAAKDCGAHFFGIVTSGTSIGSQQEWDEIYEAIEGINRLGMKPCGSLGMLNDEEARRLKSAGLFRYHHNLETSRSFFDNICTTHDYEDDIETNRAARRAGLSVCCGGIIGLGETMEQRIELALTLHEIGVDSVPINILNPIPGTPFAGNPSLSPIEILLTIAIYRFVLPDKDIKLCGGKEKNLRQLLPMAIVAGSNSLMTGDYLTTAGRDADHDIEMIRDLDLEPTQE